MKEKELETIKRREAVRKAREEYHSFMQVRELKDINSSYNLTKTMLRREKKLVNTVNSLERWKNIIKFRNSIKNKLNKIKHSARKINASIPK